jgi:hypothetical protein
LPIRDLEFERETPEKRLKRPAPASKPDQAHHLDVINRPGPWDGQRSPTSAPTGPRGVGRPAPRIGLFLRRALMVDPSPQGAEAPPWAPRMAIVWPLRPAHGTAVALRDAYECARVPSRRAVARRRGFAATAAPDTAATQKEWQNANSAENPRTNRLIKQRS